MSGISFAVAITVGQVSTFLQSLGGWRFLPFSIAICCSGNQSVGPYCRKSHVREDLRPFATRRRAYRQPMWLFGFITSVTSNLFSTIFQLDTLPVAILAPLGAVGLIYNAVNSRLFLRDAFGREGYIGTVLVMTGAVLVAVFGSVDEERHGLDELLVLWRRPAFLSFFLVVIAAVTILLVVSHLAARRIRPRIDSSRDVDSELSAVVDPMSNGASLSRPQQSLIRRVSSRSAASIDMQAGDVHDRRAHTGVEEDVRTRIPVLDNPTAAKIKDDRALTLVGLGFAAASGTLSGMSLVLAKAAVELVDKTKTWFRTGQGNNEFAYFQSWLMVGGLAVGGLSQLVYLNYSLVFASPALICPLAFTFFTMSSILDGLVFYDQFGRLNSRDVILVTVGTVTLLCGVLTISAIGAPSRQEVRGNSSIEEPADEERAVMKPLLEGDRGAE